jgi:hypothetical protein
LKSKLTFLRALVQEAAIGEKLFLSKILFTETLRVSSNPLKYGVAIVVYSRKRFFSKNQWFEKLSFRCYHLPCSSFFSSTIPRVFIDYSVSREEPEKHHKHDI